MALSRVERALRRVLLDLARHGRTATYAEVAGLLAPYSPVRLEKPFTPLHHWLGAVSRFEHEHGRPLLSALIVRAVERTAGEGFARFAQDSLGFNFPDPDAFWAEQRDAVFARWMPTRREGLLETHRIAFADGRVVRVREYEGESVRILIDDGPYAITEAFLPRGKTDRTILRFEPRIHYEQEQADED